MKFKIQPIIGDASFRTFYRLTLNKKSKIIVLAKKKKYKNLIAYSTINKFLRTNKILTPKLYTHNYAKGIIIIEDFGNLSFYRVLLKTKNKLKIYKKLIDLLLKIQKIKSKTKIKNIIGGSHKVAFIYAIENNFDFVIILHGDDQGTIKDIIPFIKEGRHKNVDALLGARFHPKSTIGEYSTFRTFCNQILNILFSLSLFKRIYDLGSGLNCYKVATLQDKFFHKYID